MKLTVQNFRGIAKAEVDLSAIALLAGANEAGKSSVAQATQALLTGEVVPIADLRKADAAMMIHAGTGSASAAIESDKGRAAIEWPKAKRETEGDPPSATPAACGMVSLPDMDGKARAEFLATYLKTEPTQADLRKALTSADFTDELFEKLWASIEAHGWQNAHQAAKERGIELKGQWLEITGEQWGSKKAESWIPAAWDSDLDGASEESLSAVLVEAQEIRDAAIAHTAISEDKVAEMRNCAGRLPDYRQELEVAENKVSAAHAEVERTMEHLKSLPSADAEEPTVPCPHCGKPLVIRGAAVAKPAVKGSSEENTKRRAESENASRAHSRAALALRQTNERVYNLCQQIHDSEAAAAELEKLTAEDGHSDAAALERARSDVQIAEQRLSAWRAKTRADSRHVSIARNQAVVAALAPDGVRQSKLRDALTGFNTRLVAIAEVALWPTVEVTEGLTILYRGTSWALCSASGQFRARVMLQVALAEIDGSDAMIIDGSDILDRTGRNGLFRLLRSIGRPALVCMTLYDKDAVPVLKTGMGKSYWVENSIAEAV